RGVPQLREVLEPFLHIPARQLRLRLASPDRIDQRPPRVPEEPAFQKHPWLEGLPGASREVAAQLRQLEGVLVRLGAKVKSHEGGEKAARRRLVRTGSPGEVGWGPRTRGEFVRNAQTRRDVDDGSDAVPRHHV